MLQCLFVAVAAVACSLADLRIDRSLEEVPDRTVLAGRISVVVVHRVRIGHKEAPVVDAVAAEAVAVDAMAAEAVAAEVVAEVAVAELAADQTPKVVGRREVVAHTAVAHLVSEDIVVVGVAAAAGVAPSGD